MNEFQQLMQETTLFVTDRNWDQFHNPKDLAISLSLEAAELLECFQWKSSEDAVAKNRSEIIKEIADIMVYCMMLSNKLDFDLLEAVRIKMAENVKKYPVELAYGRSDKYTELGKGASDK